MTEYRTYPPSYHRAISYLIAFDGHGGNRHLGRQLVARALRAVRRDFGSARARDERRHMLFISGQFPPKHIHYGRYPNGAPKWALQSDGHWMLLDPDGKRSIFDDVDE